MGYTKELTAVARLLLVALAFVLLWIRFVAIDDTETDTLGQTVTGIFTSWVLTHLITIESQWLTAYKWCALAVCISLVYIIASVDTTMYLIEKHGSDSFKVANIYPLDCAIVVNMTMLAVLEIFFKTLISSNKREPPTMPVAENLLETSNDEDNI